MRNGDIGFEKYPSLKMRYSSTNLIHDIHRFKQQSQYIDKHGPNIPKSYYHTSTVPQHSSSIYQKVNANLHYQYYRKLKNQPKGYKSQQSRYDWEQKKIDDYLQNNKKMESMRNNPFLKCRSQVFNQNSNLPNYTINKFDISTFSTDNEHDHSRKYVDPHKMRNFSQILSQYSKLRRVMPVVSDKIIQSVNSLFGNKVTFDPQQSANFIQLSQQFPKRERLMTLNNISSGESQQYFQQNKQQQNIYIESPQIRHKVSYDQFLATDKNIPKTIQYKGRQFRLIQIQ